MTTTTARRSLWITAVALVMASGMLALAAHSSDLGPGSVSEAAIATSAPTRVGVNDSLAPVSPANEVLPGSVVSIERIVDGDTIDVGLDKTIRMIGYDTPERDECGYAEATESLRVIVSSGTVTALADGDDADRYGRYLRHIYVDGIPVGLTLIEQGLANARYDSLDGYDRHLHQDVYRAADGSHNCGPGAD